jgi:hypothetical protein
VISQSQKKALEWPLLILLVFMTQALESAWLPIEVIPILVSYLAATRRWGTLAGLSAVLGILGSPSVGFPGLIYISAIIWAALFQKAILQTFRLEGQQTFVGLAGLGMLLYKILVYTFLVFAGRARPFESFALHAVTVSVLASGLAWALFPLFAKWDELFEHDPDESTELKPGALR